MEIVSLSEDEIRALLQKQVDDSTISFSISSDPVFKGKVSGRDLETPLQGGGCGVQGDPSACAGRTLSGELSAGRGGEVYHFPSFISGGLSHEFKNSGIQGKTSEKIKSRAL